MTPSSSMVSPGVTPSALERRRRRRCVALLVESSSESEPSSDSTVVLTSSVLPGRRRPRPPRRRRRPRLAASPLSSLFSTSGVTTALGTAFLREGAFFSTGAASGSVALARETFAALASTGAAWKIGTGMAAAAAFFLAGLFFSTDVAGTSTIPVGACATFLTARLRGVFGSIAMAPNPLCV
ncbi:unannotated protein [freshwater metagenome]